MAVNIYNTRFLVEYFVSLDSMCQDVCVCQVDVAAFIFLFFWFGSWSAPPFGIMAEQCGSWSAPLFGVVAEQCGRVPYLLLWLNSMEAGVPPPFWYHG